ncbi:protein kinase [Actinoplanes sp. NPDC026619]|uniref:serine/threonine-protein kinase n=1 Tax=Actinoplanes sp. NPDC026619 TaxID=3155798 RepID=UPI0033CD75A9
MLGAGVRLGDRYRLEARVGAGGMGEVWRAVDELLTRTVAVKVMLPGVAADPDFGRRFLAEATAMARVNHPAVASIHDFGRSHDHAYLVMEFVDGESIAQRLARDGRISPADTMRLVAQAADGLQAVHDQGIVHRDIKPANLLLRRDGSVVITDFGIARRDDASRLTASGAILGTPSYLSPEQVLGQAATVRSDVYSLGLTAYECLAGQKPFDGDNPYAVALQRLQAAPRTIGITLPAAVLVVLEKALATDPAHRWPSAADLAAAARAAAAGAPLPASGGAPGPASGGAPGPAAGQKVAGPEAAGPEAAGPEAAGPEAAGPKARRRLVLAGLIAFVLVAGGAATWRLNRDKSDSGGAVGATPATAGSAAASVPAGFTRCGAAFCPVEPLCWARAGCCTAWPPTRVARRPARTSISG